MNPAKAPDTKRDVSTSNADQYKPGVAPIPNLQEIYPPLKSFDQKAKEETERQQYLASRRPKYLAFKSALASSVVFYIALLLFKNLGTIWFFDGLISISFSFGAMIALLFCAYASASYTQHILYRYYDKPNLFFVIPYAIIAFLLFGGALAGWFGDFEKQGQLVLAAGLHFSVVLILLRNGLRSKE